MRIRILRHEKCWFAGTMGLGPILPYRSGTYDNTYATWKVKPDNNGGYAPIFKFLREKLK